MADSTSESADTMRERGPGSTIKLWVLMEANRWVLAGVLGAMVPVALIVVGLVAPTPLTTVAENKDPLETLFQAMVGAIITGVTLVVTLNQLVLAQELGPAGDQRDRMNGAMDFRLAVEEQTGEAVSPVEPSAFLLLLVDTVRTQANTLSDVVESEKSSHLRADVEEFVTSITDNADQVTTDLETAEFGTFQVLGAALDFNYSSKIHEARELRADHEPHLSERGETAIDEVVKTLELFGPAREHFKTLYFEWELINLSRDVLYTAIPAFITAGCMILFVDSPASIPGVTAGIPNVLLVTSLAVGVTLVPFILLFSYILRIATVAKRTLAIGPFILREKNNS